MNYNKFTIDFTCTTSKDRLYEESFAVFDDVSQKWVFSPAFFAGIGTDTLSRYSLIPVGGDMKDRWMMVHDNTFIGEDNWTKWVSFSVVDNKKQVALYGDVRYSFLKCEPQADYLPELIRYVSSIRLIPKSPGAEASTHDHTPAQNLRDR